MKDSNLRIRKDYTIFKKLINEEILKYNSNNNFPKTLEDLIDKIGSKKIEFKNIFDLTEEFNKKCKKKYKYKIVINSLEYYNKTYDWKINPIVINYFYLNIEEHINENTKYNYNKLKKKCEDEKESKLIKYIADNKCISWMGIKEALEFISDKKVANFLMERKNNKDIYTKNVEKIIQEQENENPYMKNMEEKTAYKVSCVEEYFNRCNNPNFMEVMKILNYIRVKDTINFLNKNKGKFNEGNMQKIEKIVEGIN